MCFTHFTLTQDGHAIGDFTAKELAVSTARQHAVDTGKPVTLVVHIADGGTREAIEYSHPASQGLLKTPLDYIQKPARKNPSPWVQLQR